MSFQFGGSNSGAGDNKAPAPGAFSFGGGSSTTPSPAPAFGSFGFGTAMASSSATGSGNAPAFSFGGGGGTLPSGSGSGSAPSFSFGGGGTGASSSAFGNGNAPTFAFGGGAAAGNSDAKSAAFSFVGGSSSGTPAPASSLSFGVSTASLATSAPTATSGSFSFGASKNGRLPEKPVDMPTFSLGNDAKRSAPSSAFKGFSSLKHVASSSGLSFEKETKPSEMKAAPNSTSFGFGAAATVVMDDKTSIKPSGAFSFGSPAATTPAAPASTGTAFAFGSATAEKSTLLKKAPHKTTAKVIIPKPATPVLAPKMPLESFPPFPTAKMSETTTLKVAASSPGPKTTAVKAAKQLIGQGTSLCKMAKQMNRKAKAKQKLTLDKILSKVAKTTPSMPPIKRRANQALRTSDIIVQKPTLKTTADLFLLYSSPVFSISMCRKALKKTKKKDDQIIANIPAKEEEETCPITSGNQHAPVSKNDEKKTGKSPSTKKPKVKHSRLSDRSFERPSKAADLIALPKGVTQRASGKWQAQVYFAGASRYVGVFHSCEHANTAFTSFKDYLLPYRKGASEGRYSKDDLQMLIDQGRIHASQIVKESYPHDGSDSEEEQEDEDFYIKQDEIAPNHTDAKTDIISPPSGLTGGNS